MTLSYDSRALLDAVKGAHGPTPAQKLALKANIDAAIAAGAVASVSTTAGLSHATKLGFAGKVGLAALAVAVVGGGVAALLAFRAAEPRLALQPAVARVEAAPVEREVKEQGSAPDEERAPVSAPEVALPAPSLAKPHFGAARRRSLPGAPTAPAEVEAPAEVVEQPVIAPPTADEPSQLKAELEQLKRALAAVNAGQLDAALAALDGWEQRFPLGVMGVEAKAMRVDALCRAGRSDEASALAKQLTSQARNPAVAKLRSSCAGPVFDVR